MGFDGTNNDMGAGFDLFFCLLGSVLFEGEVSTGSGSDRVGRQQ